MTDTTLPEFTSRGHTLDPATMSWLTPSNDLLRDPKALRARFAEEGYLYLKNILDRRRVEEARRAITNRLAAEGELHPDHDPMEGIVCPPELKGSKGSSFRPDLAGREAAVKRVVFGEELARFYTNFFDEPVMHFDYIWMRAMKPGQGTASHCDWVYMGRGSRRLMTCWIPYGEVPLSIGGLMLLERSHLQADRIRRYLEVDVDAYCENDPDATEKVAKQGGWSHPGWLSHYPESLPKKFNSRWLTSPHFEMGDVLTFNMTMIHGSLDNHSDRIRLSTDTRWQPASEPADERWIGANPPGHGLAGKQGRIC